MNTDDRIWQELMRVRNMRDDPEREAAGGMKGLHRLAPLADELGISQYDLAVRLADLSLQSRRGRLEWQHATEGRANRAEIDGAEGFELLVSEACGGAEPPDDRVAWDAVALLLSRYAGSVVPASIANLASGVMREESKRPSVQKGVRPAKKREHDSLIGAVRLAMESGLDATRNDASEPHSCCDVVAERAALIGIETTPESLARKWNRYLKNR